MNYRDPTSIPLPTSDEEFERLCLLIARDRYGAEYYRYGRKGQSQHGIDIYSAYYDGRCLQCKLHKKEISDAELIRELKEDLKKAKVKFGDIKQFIFAVSIETRPAIQNVCKNLSDTTLKVIPWFWNQLQEDIARSNWLLRYYLNYISGAQWINDDFVQQELHKGNDKAWQPISFYSSNTFAQWYGILKNWDAHRQHYKSICQAIKNSFADPYSDMPVGAIVRGEGGSGKSVLLRRIAIELRNTYTVYWITDNAEDFLNNEWIYDIENNLDEKYLLILEDWYKNFTSTEDSITANKLLHKVKEKANVRLLIGDRLSTKIYYPKPKESIFDLESKENILLLPYIIDHIPEWKNKFAEEQKDQLLRIGLFQLLFIYQYANALKVLPKAENYFTEIIQSDYKQLCNTDNSFYKGLASAFFVYANLYTNYSLRLSPEAVIVLAENYSGVSRPSKLKQNTEALLNDPIVQRYFDIIPKKTGERHFLQLHFLHDTLADEGWKNIKIDVRQSVDLSNSVIEILGILKTERTSLDLINLLSSFLKLRKGSLTSEQVYKFLDFPDEVQIESGEYTKILFSDQLIKLSNEYRLKILHRIRETGKKDDGFWGNVIVWLKMKSKNKIEILKMLVSCGNVSYSVLSNYFRLIPFHELKSAAIGFLSDQIIIDPYYSRVVPVIFERLSLDAEIKEIARNYLHFPESWRISQTFISAIKILNKGDEIIAKEKAREYLNLNELSYDDRFITCIQILEDELLAKEKAREYLRLNKEKGQVEIFNVCLKVLKTEVSGIAKEILETSIENINTQTLYHCLQIACLDESLHSVTANLVRKIFDKKFIPKFYIHYLTTMQVPLLHIQIWQQEANFLLRNYRKIDSDLFYKLTLSLDDKPELLTEACLYFIRNWKKEFNKSKRFWGYFIRSLAHPTIQEQPKLKIEILSLCKEMLIDFNHPEKLDQWLLAITNENKFPKWTRKGTDD